MEDGKIIDLYWARSQQAIAESEKKYGPYCHTIARRILDREEDAEECVNDTWLHACLPDRRSPDEELEAGETAALISAFLRRQSELDRVIFVRRYFHLEPLDSLARRHGLSLGQVKSKLHRMRSKLRQELEREGVAV